MRRLTFEEAVHGTGWGNEQYAIDFSHVTPRKYKQVERGLRVYEGGLIEIESDTSRDANLRWEYRRAYDLDFVRIGDSSGIKFSMPDGTPVKKCNIKHNLIMIDWDHAVAVAFSEQGIYRRRGIYYPSWDALPVGKVRVHTKERDRYAEDKWLEENDEFLKLCVTTYHMGQGNADMWMMHVSQLKPLFQRNYAVVGNDQDTARMRFSVGGHYTSGELFKQLREHFKKTVTAPYLRVTKE